MSWWDHIDLESEQRDWVPTISAIPECMHLASADARAAVVIALETAQTEQDTLRLLKLLHFMDRLMFAQPALEEEDKDEFEDSKLDAVISARLHRFWRGDWQGLWADTLAAAKLRRRAGQSMGSDARAEAEVRKLEKLIRATELGKAAGQVARGQGGASSGGH